ncbi:MAG: hypothetical protein HOP19_12015 [Acidobacteria bacterium]|nr:hypothetical protein [Acidobacteriota bacterium]
MQLIACWVLLFYSLFVFVPLSVLLQVQAQRSKWKAAHYRGVIVGKSFIAEALKLFGKPYSVSLEADHDVDDPDTPLLYQYQQGGDFQGSLDFVVDKRSKRILEIRVTPDHLTKERAITHFGRDYIQRRYSFCPDVDDTAAPIYEDPTGDVIQIEYPHKGIILSVNGENEVTNIAYVSTNLALGSESKCKKGR